MYRSLRSRVLLVVTAAVVMTALSILFFAQRDMETAVTRAEGQHARDLLDAVQLSVEIEYESLLFHRASTLERRQAELKNIVTIAISHIDEHFQRYQQGLLSERQARQLAISAIDKLRYDEGVGYIWINDMGRPVPRMVMHPTLPELNGKLLDDPSFNTAQGVGKNLFAAAVEACLQNGEGFIDYLWPKPTRKGLSEDQPKISYVRHFPEWDWVLGTGVYIDDIEAETEKRLAAIIAELKKTLAKVRIAGSGYMFIFNGRGEMLIHPNIEGHEFATQRNPETDRLMFDELSAAAKTSHRTLNYTWDKPGFEGQYRFPKKLFVSHFEPLDWYIGSSIYIDELAQPGLKLQKEIIYLSLTTLCIALVIAFALSRGMTKPLWQLTRSAKAIEKNGLAAAEIPVAGTTETQALGRVLGTMVDSLRHAEEELRGANWELETFVNTVSHDLRTPLTPIIGYAEFLQENYREQLDENALECLKEIETQGNRIHEHMNDLLTLAQTGYLERPESPVVTATVVSEVLADLETKIAESGAEIVLQPLPNVSLPTTLLAQVFVNLIGNALRYAGGKENPIEVGGHLHEGHACFYVRDHGPGIPEQERDKIFQIFFRGSTGKQISGTGIGLAIVQKVARTYGGKAWVEETPGGGSTFWFKVEES